MSQVVDKRKLTAPLNGLLGGRPPGSHGEVYRLNQAFKEHLVKLIEKNKGPLIEAMIKEALDGNVEAFKALLDRAQGKPAQAVEVSGQNGNPIVFMPLELIQKHSLQVIEGQQTPLIDGNVKQGVEPVQ